MSNLFVKLFVSISFLLSVGLSEKVAARGPTTSGGGGNFCYPYSSSKPILLDMASVQGNVSLDDNLPGVQIQAFENVKYKAVNVLTSVMQQRIEIRLQNFAQNYPQLYERIMWGVKNTWFFATNKKFNSAIGAYFESQQCHAGNTRAVIGFMGGVKIISVEAWNQASLDTQAYTLIHEGVRFATTFRAFNITNRTLQELVRYAIAGSGLITDHVSSLIDPYYVSLGMGNLHKPAMCNTWNILKKIRPSINHEALRFFQFSCENPFKFKNSLKEEAEHTRNLLAQDYKANLDPQRRTKLKDAAEMVDATLNELALNDLNTSEMSVCFVMFNYGISNANELLLSNDSRKANNKKELINNLDKIMKDLNGTL